MSLGLLSIDLRFPTSDMAAAGTLDSAAAPSSLAWLRTTFDKVLNDQAIGFRYLESDSGEYQSALEMWQPPNVSSEVEQNKIAEANKITDKAKRDAAFQALRNSHEITVNRLFLGKRRNDANELLMADSAGRARIRLQVAPDGSPKLEFMDENGKVIYSLPDKATGRK